MELGVLAHKGDGDAAAGAFDALHHGAPVGEVGALGGESQLAAHHLGQPLFFQHQRHLIEGGGREVGDHARRLHVAKKSDLPADLLRQRGVAAAHQHVWLDALGEQFLDGVLGGLAFQLAGAGDLHHQRHMDEKDVAVSLFTGHLPGGLQIGLAFDIAHGAADLADGHIRRFTFHGVDAPLDLVGDVGDDLHGAAQIAALPLPVQNAPEDLAGGNGGIPGEVFVHKAFVVPQIQIGFGAVVGDEDLAVLIGAHGAGVDVEVGVKFLVPHGKTPLLEEPSQRRGADALAQARYHASCDKNVLHIHSSVQPVRANLT